MTNRIRKTVSITRLVPILLLSLFLTGCLEGATESVGNLFSSGPSAPEEILIKGTALEPENIPWHMKAAVAATVLRMKGGDPATIDAEFNMQGSAGIGQDEETNISDFVVFNVMINDFYEPEKAPGVFRLGARLIMMDQTSRRFGFSFVADYELSGKQMVLKGHSWDYIRSAAPGVDTYVVPTETLEALDLDQARDYATFRGHVLENAVKTGDGAAVGKKNYTIVTFILDKILEEDKVEVSISDVKEGNEGFKDDTRYVLHDNGWVTAAIPGNFSLGTDEAFWIKSVYIPKKKDESLLGFLDTGILIGLFNTANLTVSNTPES
jgi:hypothetical protein